jgi:hypothetical protein
LMDPDLNKYDLNHRVAHHGKMSDQEWEEAYRAAWTCYYEPAHIRTILRRAAVNRMRFLKSLLSTLLWFHLMIACENLHPLEGGALRLKFRKDRCPGLPIESPFVFYPRLARETLRKLARYWTTIRRFKAIMKEVRDAPDRASYTDVAITPQENHEFEELALYQATTGGEGALARKRRDEAIRAGGVLPARAEEAVAR